MAYMTDNDKIYNSWRKMHIRCYDRNYHSYHRSGGRGIIVAPAWHQYEQFKHDMAASWFEGATIDRINNDGNYTLGNCRWATKAENAKPYKYDFAELLALEAKGYKQSEIAEMLGTYQPHISRLLRKARRAQKA